MLLDEIADYLTSVPSISGVVIYVGFMPSHPDTCVALYPTGGFASDGAYGYDDPTFQVATRGATFAGAHNIAADVYSALQGLHHITLSAGTYITNCLALQSAPQSIGRDEQERSEYTQNFRIRCRNKTTHRV